jgi:membrane dipeptidase
MNNIVLDAHCDMLNDVLLYRSRGERNVLERRFLPSLSRAGIGAVICSLFIRDELLPEMALRGALDQISALCCDLDESRGFELARSASDARRAARSGKTALFLSFEGAEPIGSDIFLLRAFYELGVRFFGLTWSRRNYVADGCSFKAEDAPHTEGGLTEFGRRAVKAARELNMVIDVSHLNDAGFWEIAQDADVPFIASHSNCRALSPSPRNLTDEQIRAVAESGGVIGLNAYSPFTADARGDGSADKLVEHAAHIGEVAGLEHAGLGLDLCDCLASFAPARGERGGDIFKDHGEAAEELFPRLRSEFGEEAARGILGGNFMRVIENVIG